MKKKILCMYIIFVMICTYNLKILAASVDSLNKTKSEAEASKSEAQEELKNIQSEKKSTMDEVSELSNQMSSVQSEVDDLQAKEDELNSSIETKETEITEKEKQKGEKEELLKTRLVAMYKNGNISYLDVLLGSSNYIDMIASYDAVKEITDADTNLINEIVAAKSELEEAKKELEEEKQEVDTLKAEKEAKKLVLAEKKAEKDAKVSQLSSDEKSKQAEIDKFNAAIASAEAEIKRQVEAAKRSSSSSSGGSSSSSGGGYVDNSSGSLGWPLPSRYQSYSYITSYFGRRSAPTAGASTNHGAIDIGASYQPVYAAESGVVVAASYWSGYGNFIMIWHKSRGELYTCYGHLSSYNVSSGDSVSRGQQIATSGNTGISTGPHLHFEVRSGGNGSGNRVDPLGYLSL